MGGDEGVLQSFTSYEMTPRPPVCDASTPTPPLRIQVGGGASGGGCQEYTGKLVRSMRSDSVVDVGAQRGGGGGDTHTIS